MFALYQNTEGIYHVCDKSSFENNTSKTDLLIDREPMIFIAYNDSKETLDQLCCNLNSKSPRIDLRDDNSRKSEVTCKKGPRIIDDQFIQPKKIIFRLSIPKKDQNASYPEEVDMSGPSHNPSDTEATLESEINSQQNSTIESNNNASLNTDISSYNPSDTEATLESEINSQQNSTIESNNNTSLNTDISSSSVDQQCLDKSDDKKLSFNVPGNSAVDDQDVRVDITDEVKKNFCLFCKSYQCELARHLIRKHSDEERVAEFMKLTPKSLKRKRLIAKIRKEGNFLLFDKNINDGKIIPTRRPTNEEKCSGKNYVPCPECKGIYTKNNIRHHYYTCGDKEKSSKGILKMARATIGRTHECASIRMRQTVLPRMQEDDVVRTIRYDLLLILYGNNLCLRHRREYRNKMIRQNLRQCGKFLMFLKEKNAKISDFASIYDTNLFHFVLESIDGFVGLNEDTGHYKSASNATSLTRHIKEIGKIYRTECIVNKDYEKEKEIKKFLHLCTTGFASVTNKTAMETLVAQQRKKEVILPLSTDIARLNDYLDTLIDKYYVNLKSKFSIVVWRNLSEALLSRVQVFNRRRPGEIERLEIDDLKNMQSIKEDDEDYKSLSEEEKKAAKEYVRVSMRGKLNSSVPVLLTKKWHEIMLLVVKLRRRAQVKSNNLHVFGIAGMDKHATLSATTLLRNFSEKCNAEKPKALRATSLRKHAATKCVHLGLDETNTVNFAKFMGHDLKIHKNIYRQSVTKTDILGISKVLETASKPKENDINQSSSSQADRDLQNLSIDDTMDFSTDTSPIIYKRSKGRSQKKNKPMNTHHDKFKENYTTTKARWTDEEIRCVKMHFADNLKTGKLPSLPQIRNIQKNYGILENRQAQVVKAWINNQLVHKKKKK